MSSNPIFNLSLVRKNLSWILLLSLLVACGDTPTAIPATSGATSAATASVGASSSGNQDKVVFILPGSSNDASWNSKGFEAVVKLRRELGVTVDYVENVSPDKEIPVMREWAGKGYGLIITHGGQFGNSIKQVAPDFPKTWFVQFNGTISGPNYASLSIKYEEAAYLAGVISAKAVPGDKFGLIFPKLAVFDSLIAGYKQGLVAVKSQSQLYIELMDNFQDGAKATALANSLYDRGVDLVFYDVNVLEQPVLQVAQARSKLVISFPVDINYLAPNTVLTSYLVTVPSLPVRLWQTKQLEGKNYQVGLKDLALDLAPLRGKLPAADEAEVERLKQEIMAGKLKIEPTLKP